MIAVYILNITATIFFIIAFISIFSIKWNKFSLSLFIISLALFILAAFIYLIYSPSNEQICINKVNKMTWQNNDNKNLALLKCNQDDNYIPILIPIGR